MIGPHLGLSLPNRGVLFGATTARQLVDLAERAEATGVFGSVWVGDSDVFERPYLEMWVAAGPPERVAARIRAYLDAGCTIPVLRFASWKQAEQLHRFVGDVFPRLRDALAPVPSAARS